MTNFSVSICVYGKDNPSHFRDALKSIIEQSMPPNEIVLVIDGPLNNDLEDVISEFDSSFPNFKIIRFSQNKGHGEARRRGIESCTNELIAIMDADDICVRDRFEKQLTAFENFDVDVIGGQILEFIDEPNNIVGCRRVPLSDGEIKSYLKKRCPMNQVTIMMKKSSYLEAGGYLDWFQEEDYYLWTRMVLNNNVFMNLDDILVKVRVGKEMYSRRGGYKYFKSERMFQKFLLRNKLIGLVRYTINVIERFIVQVLMTNKLRTKFFRKIRNRYEE